VVVDEWLSLFTKDLLAVGKSILELGERAALAEMCGGKRREAQRSF
jgi:hypothetical protein